MHQLSEDNRRTRIAAEIKALSDKPGDVERLRVPWKSQHEVCPVIDLPMEAVVLNNRSHRIRAQLESCPERDLVESDPFSVESQTILADLLRGDEGFDDLKANLDEEGQRNPGIVTRVGLLVNANRRAIALRDLGRDYIRVAVLPVGATNKQVAELELTLQMTKEFRQEYTFTNQLLFVEELRSLHRYPAKKIAQLLRYAQSSSSQHVAEGVARVEQATRMLAMIQEIMGLSQGTIPYTHFDDQRQSLLELDDAYQKLLKQDPLAAERLRWTRFVGLITSSGYKVLRRVDSEFYNDYLVPALEDDEQLTEIVPAETLTSEGRGADELEEELGLDLLDPTSTQGTEGPDPARLVEWLAGLDKYVEMPARGDLRSISVSRESLVTQVGSSLQGASEQATLDEKKEKRVEAPINRVAEAIAKLHRARSSLPPAIADPEFDAPKFTYQLNKLEKAAKRLRETFDHTQTHE